MKALQYLSFTILLFISTSSLAQTSVGFAYITPDSLSCLKDQVKLGFIAYGTGYNWTDNMNYEVHWGDGSISKGGQPRSVGSFFNVFHQYSTGGNYSVLVIAIGKDGKRDSTTTRFLVGTCKTISGNIYNDLNSNCQLNPGELFATEVIAIAKEKSTGALVWTTANVSTGAYSIEVPDGFAYELTAKNDPNYLSNSTLPVSCPIGGYSINTLPATGKDMGLACYPGFDISPFLSSGPHFRPGKTAYLNLILNNFGCSNKLTELKVILSDPKMTYNGWNASSNLPPPLVNGDTLEWNEMVYSNSFLSEYIATNISSSAKIGDTMCVDVIANPIAGDVHPANNTKQFCFPIKYSYDPNAKSAYPLGNGSDHNIREGDLITYTVQFQNTGTAPAFDVVIRDVIHSSLNQNTLKVLGATHPFELTNGGNNELIFTFPDINLPDSGSDFAGSQGQVSFQLNTKLNLPLGTRITNSAAIYFDSNPPIITNEVFHTISSANGIAESDSKTNIRIFPNPASELLKVEILSDETTDLKIFDVTGKELLNLKLNKGLNNIDLSNLVNGLYLVVVESSSNQFNERIVVQR